MRIQERRTWLVGVRNTNSDLDRIHPFDGPLLPSAMRKYANVFCAGRASTHGRVSGARVWLGDTRMGEVCRGYSRHMCWASKVVMRRDLYSPIAVDGPWPPVAEA
jgi:hypothetical protein